ncbi:MAG: helix-turn-helix transcriptional regulator [Candidatus Limnocylindrales bacterium]
MVDVRRLVSPVMVGRDDLLALAERRIQEVSSDGGRCLLLVGEAGVGKTRLLGSIERRAIEAGFRSVRGGAYPSDLQVPGAILIDLARAMQRQPGLAEVGRLIDDRLAADDARSDALRTSGGDAARRRRALVLDVADLLAGVGPRDAPTIVLLEDLHWSDDLTLEILEALARRIPETGLLVIGTYRSDELYPRAPMRAWRARLVSQRQAEEIRLGRLSVADTAALAARLIGSGVAQARDLAEAIHDRTDGIPLHVEELMAVLGDRPDLDARSVRDAEVPETVEDAIRARLALRSAAAAEVARAGAVIGRSFDLDLLCEVTGQAPEALSAPLAELADHFILLSSATPGRFGFRHALICDVIYAQIPEPDRRSLHARTADAGVARRDVGTGPFLALHFERAGRFDEAHRAARSAGDAAWGLSSHGEAFELYACALRTAPATLDPAARAGLLEAYGRSAAAIDDNETAAQALAAAQAAYRRAGRPLEAAEIVAPLVAVQHLLGAGLEARADRLHEAIAEIELRPAPLGSAEDAAAIRVRGRLEAAMAAAYMLDRRLDVAMEHGLDARRLAASIGDQETIHNASTTLGSSLVFAGRMDEGWGTLEATINAARADGREAEMTRAYRMLGSSASALVEYERAETWLRAGIAEADRLELWNHRHYMASHLAHVAWATGRWDDAADLAQRALADGRGGITTRVAALTVLGYVAMGRGSLSGARTALEEARAMGSAMGELQRLSPALWGLAEVALADDAPARALEFAETALVASEAVDDAAYVFPFLVTGTRAALATRDPAAARRLIDRGSALVTARGIPGTLPAIDHAVGLLAAADGATGQARTHLSAAADGWTRVGRAWEGAWALVDLARVHVRSNQRQDGARRAAEARDRGRALGAPAIVAAGEDVLRSATRRDGAPDPWAPLTAREFEVARHIADGRTNIEIAQYLSISPKTAASHVEHILAKLGVGRRAEIAVWTASRPVLHSRPHGDDREE